MIQLLGVSTKSSEYHEEIGKSRTIQDYKDWQKLYEWLTNTVSSKDKDHVNCKQAEQVGKTIQRGLDNILFDTATIKRKDLTTNLESLQKTKKRWQN